MAPVAIEVELPNVEKRVGSIGKAATEARLKTMIQALQVLEGEVRISIQRDWLSNASAQSRRTGALARSFRAEIRVNNQDRFVGVVGSDLPYARIHELGGQITPTRAKALTIPMNPRSIPLGKSARDFGDLFVWRNKKTGKAFLARSVGKNKLELVYALVRRVTIQPKGYLKRAEERAAPKIEALLGKKILTSIRGEG